MLKSEISSDYVCRMYLSCGFDILLSVVDRKRVAFVEYPKGLLRRVYYDEGVREWCYLKDEPPYTGALNIVKILPCEPPCENCGFPADECICGMQDEE